jgi:MFS transporter, SP family, galactose:H+ symporter
MRLHLGGSPSDPAGRMDAARYLPAGVATAINTQPTADSPLSEIPEERLRKVRGWGLIITIGSFLFGFDTGVVSGALLFIREDFALDAVEQGAVVSVLLLGAIFGALFAGRVADRFGRKATLGILAVVFAVGIAVAALATEYWMLMLGRIVMGLGVGGVSATVPTYLSEVSPPQIRGRMLTLNQLLITVGLLASYLVNLAFSSSGDWRAMFWVGAVPAVALAIGTLRLPESPAWLIAHGRSDEARRIVESVADAAAADRMIEGFRRRQAERRRAEAAGEHQRKGWRLLLAPSVRAAVVVGLTLAAVQQFAGINTILYYAPTIMQETGLSASNSIFYSVFIGVINLGMTVVSIRLVDRVGRRVLLLVSLAGMLVSLGLLGLSFVADLSSVITLLFMLLYIVAFAIGMGPVFWVLVGELFPPRERAEGAGASSTTNWLANFVVGLAFLPVVDAIGQGETFWLFAVVCAFGLWFVSRYVPETRGRTYEQIDAELHTRWRGKAPTGAAPLGR